MPTDLPDRIAETLAALAGDGPVCVGFSGGPDSTALVLALRDRLEPARIVPAHLNHHLRGEADADEAFVRARAAHWGLPLVVGHWNRHGGTERRGETDGRGGTDISGSGGTDIRVCPDHPGENDARCARYAFLEATARRHGCPVVAVGHHADDNAETILFRIARGTALRGLAGMRPSRPLSTDGSIRLIRPLLELRRTEILEFLRDRGEPFVEDRSNFDPRFARNRVRHDALPALARVSGHDPVPAVLRLAALALSSADRLDRAADDAMRRATVECVEGRITLDSATLDGCDADVRAEVLRRAACRLGSPPDRLGFDRLTTLVGPAAVQLPGGVRVEFPPDRIVLSSDDARNECVAPSARFELSVPGSVMLPNGVELHANLEPMTGSPTPRDGEERIDADRVVGALVVRAPAPGDRFQGLGAPGSKSLNDFLKDNGIPAAQRPSAIVVADEIGPLWLPGLRIADRVKLTAATTRVLRLRFVASSPVTRG